MRETRAADPVSPPQASARGAELSAQGPAEYGKGSVGVKVIRDHLDASIILQ